MQNFDFEAEIDEKAKIDSIPNQLEDISEKHQHTPSSPGMSPGGFNKNTTQENIETEPDMMPKLETNQLPSFSPKLLEIQQKIELQEPYIIFNEFKSIPSKFWKVPKSAKNGIRAEPSASGEVSHHVIRRDEFNWS